MKNLAESVAASLIAAVVLSACTALVAAVTGTPDGVGLEFLASCVALVGGLVPAIVLRIPAAKRGQLLSLLLLVLVLASGGLGMWHVAYHFSPWGWSGVLLVINVGLAIAATLLARSWR